MPINDKQAQSEQRKIIKSRNSTVWTVANLVTLIRMALIVPFLYFISLREFGVALMFFFIASVTDYVDGYIARKFNQQSALGQVLDPLADKLLTTAAFIVMAIPRASFPSIPAWLAIAVVARDLLILVGSVIIHFATGYKQFKPTLLGKINTFLEMGLIVFFLAFHTAGVFISLLPLCYAIVLVSVVASGFGYVLQGIRIFKQKP